MTTERAGAGLDVFGLSNPTPVGTGGGGLGRGPARYGVSQYGPGGERLPEDTRYWWVEIYDMGGGLNLQRGSFLEAHDRILSADAVDTRFPRHLILSQLMTVATTPDPDTFEALGMFIWHANVFGTLAIAMSGLGATVATTDNAYLWKETSVTDPVIVDTTYDPDSTNADPTVTGIWPIVIGGSGNTRRLAVGRVVGGAQVLSDLSIPPTVAGTMHTSTTAAQGMIQVPLPDQPILIYTRSGTMYSLPASSAITADPGSATLSGLPDFGFDIGAFSLGGRPTRAYWVMASSAFAADYAVYSTNLYGRDFQKLDFPLATVYQAIYVRGGILASDLRQSWWTNGRVMKPMNILSDRPTDSARERFVSGFFSPNQIDLYARIHEMPFAGAAGTNIEWLEWYDWNNDCWQPVSDNNTWTGASANNWFTLQAFAATGKGLPFSNATRYLHWYNDGSWKRQYGPQPGVNPYGQRKTTGAPTGSGQSYANGGVVYMPWFTIPGIEGWALAVKRMWFGGDVDTGWASEGIAPYVQVQAGGMTAKFVAGQQVAGRGRQMISFWENDNVVYELQPIITIARVNTATDESKFTPQVFPIRIEGLAKRPEWKASTDFSDDTRG